MSLPMQSGFGSIGQTAIRNHTPKSDAKEGLRLAVDNARMAYRAERFKDGNPVPSDLGGNPIPDREDAHVIYLDPTWGQLTFRVAEAEGGWDQILVHSGNGSVKIGSELLDPDVKSRWLQFHEKHKNLGVATVGGNARRPQTPDDAWIP